MRLRSILHILIVVLLLACTRAGDLEAERAQRAEKGQGDVVVAMVWDDPSTATLADEGARLAAAQINAKGGVLGRRLRLQIHGNVSRTREHDVARTIAADPNVVAVIGHRISDIAIPVSLTYQEAGVLFISTGATTPKLTNHGFPYIFRNIPSDVDTGKVLADYCLAKGFQKMIVVDDESEYGVTLSNIFVENAAAGSMEILLRKSYFPWQTDFSFMLHEIKEHGGDAIFLGGTIPQAAEVIKQARQMGITIPFVGGDGLDEPILWKIAGSAAEGTIVSTIFNPTAADPVTEKFVRQFQATYGCSPDIWAALAYDAVCLLNDVYRQAKSTVPLVAASFLRFIENRRSVMGTYSFARQGDVIGKEFFFKIVRNGKFEYEGNLKARGREDEHF